MVIRKIRKIFLKTMVIRKIFEPNATLQSWDEMSHVFQGTRFELLPEAKEAISKIADFTNQLFKI